MLGIALLLCLSGISTAQEPTILTLPIAGALGEHGVYGSVISVDQTGTVITINCPTPPPTSSDNTYYPNPDENCVYPEVTLTVNPSVSMLYVNFAQPPMLTANNTCNYVVTPTPAVTCTQTVRAQVDESEAASVNGAMVTPMFSISTGISEDSGEDATFAPVTITGGLDKLSAGPTLSVTSGALPEPSTGAAVAMSEGLGKTGLTIAGIMGAVFAL